MFAPYVPFANMEMDSLANKLIQLIHVLIKFFDRIQNRECVNHHVHLKNECA